MLPAKSNFSSTAPERGFSLIEVMISMGLLTIVSLSVAQLFAISTRATHMARGTTSTMALAEQKLEQLRALSWGFTTDGSGLPLSDTTTNLAVTPANATGAGLNPSPSDALDRNTTGLVDYLDENGVWLGTGTTPPARTVYIRRWSITPLPTNPNNTLILQVFVSPLAIELTRGNSTTARERRSGEAWLVSVKTRKAP
jgi:prepilin-type N-terminal cleavage/methylation domain-containing protein